jgi:ATP-binding cassette, subfamily C (CFTR/MRP), member 1
MAKPSSTDGYGWLGMLTFAWVNAPIKKARKDDLELSDLYLPADSGADRCYEEFDEVWKIRSSKGLKRPLVGALIQLYGKRFFVGGAFKLAWSFFVICGAFYFVRSLLKHVDDKDTSNHTYSPGWTGWVLAIGFFGAATLWGAVLDGRAWFCHVRTDPADHQSRTLRHACSLHGNASPIF